jgi:hypothetical protein
MRVAGPVIPVPRGFPAERTQLAPLQRQQWTRVEHWRNAGRHGNL